MAAQDVICLLLPVQLHDDREHKQVMLVPTLQLGLTLFFPSSSTMTGQDVIRFLFLLNLQYRKHKQVIPAPTPPTSPRILLAMQLYYGSTRCDSSVAWRARFHVQEDYPCL
jgi:hypothetical protein